MNPTPQQIIDKLQERLTREPISITVDNPLYTLEELRLEITASLLEDYAVELYALPDDEFWAVIKAKEVAQ